MKESTMTSSDGFVPRSDLAELAEINKQLALLPHPNPATKDGLAELRQMAFAPSVEMANQVTNEVIARPGGDLRLHIIRPAGPVKAVLLDIHGGGWSIGTPEENDWFNDLFASTCHIAVVSVDYRLAPENPYPAGLEDCVAAAQWLDEHVEAEFGTDRLLVAGYSAGAHLAAQTLLRLRDQDPAAFARFAAANLVYGPYDISQTPSQRYADDDTLILTRDWLTGFLNNTFAGDPEARRDPSVSPLYADLTGMPPALFTVGTLDPLLDDSLFMAARWTAAGSHADLDVWQDAVHGFNYMAPKTGRAAMERIADWMKNRLGA
jgi:acetyl esterase/lipase